MKKILTSFFAFLVILLIILGFKSFFQIYAQQYPWLSLPDVDPQTGEYYDVEIKTWAYLNKINFNGSLINRAMTKFKVTGHKVENLDHLYGFSIRPSQNGEDPSGIVTFNRNPYSPDISIFESDYYPVVSDNCLDLYDNEQKDEIGYVASFCFRPIYLSPDADPNNRQERRVYSLSSNPWLKFFYTGTNDTLMMFVTNAYPKNEGVYLRRVNYLTIDLRTSLPSNYQNITYYFMPITSGLSNEQMDQICNLGPDYPKKYIRVGNHRLDGSTLLEITDGQMCNFQYHTNYLIRSYMGFWMEGGLPFPEQTPSPTISLSPSPTITATPSPVATNTPIPTMTAVPPPVATNTPIPTMTAVPPPFSWKKIRKPLPSKPIDILEPVSVSQPVNN